MKAFSESICKKCIKAPQRPSVHLQIHVTSPLCWDTAYENMEKVIKDASEKKLPWIKIDDEQNKIQRLLQ